MEENQFYTSIEDAKVEIQKRWNNVELKKKIEEYLTKDIPEPLCNEPRGILFRNIAMLDMEYTRFTELSKKVGVKPLGLEYAKDKFCTRNSDKLCYGRIPIFEKLDKNGGAIMSYEKVFDVKRDDNKVLDQIETAWKENLVTFHHRALHTEFPNAELYDLSNWISRNGGKAVEYYQNFFMLTICHGVLFESFIMNDNTEESKFFNEVIAPSFKKINNIFNLKPLIVDLYSEKEKVESYWLCCPNSMRKIVKESNK